MPPNSIVTPEPEPETHNIPMGGKPFDSGEPGVLSPPGGPPQLYVESNYKLVIFQSTANLLAHILIGMIVGIVYCFTLRAGVPLGATPLHITLCVTGYQLLMAEAILSLANQNGWSSKLRLVDKRRAHWILQILGSGLAIAGSIIKMLDKTVHFNSLHSQFALVALVFTTVSLVNGIATLWSYELRGMIPASLSKLTHICFGTVGFTAACICLCYGLDKNNFRNWASAAVADAAIAFTVILLVIVIANPLISFYGKSKVAMKGIR